MTTAPGRTLSHYRLVEQIGEGGMGVVWKAEDGILHRMVAIKVLPADTSRDEKRRQMFLEEARLAASVSDLHIVQVYELGRQDDLDYIVMEYVEGKPLGALIHGRPMSPDTVATLGCQVARALSRAHRKGLLHRDLKPGNILVTADGDVKVVDFGLATLFTRGEASAASETSTLSVADVGEADASAAITARKGPLVGTIPYMSPEQVRGERLDTRSDIFSLGTVLYEMTTGHRPFAGRTQVETLQEILKARPLPVHDRVPKVPLELDRIIQKSMAAHRMERYQTMEDLAVDLKRLGRDLESGSSPTYDELRAPLARSRLRTLRFRALAAAAAIAVVGLAAWALGSRWASSPAGSAQSVLILPLEVHGQQDGADYVGRAFAEALAVSLAQSKSLRVLPVPARDAPRSDPSDWSSAAVAAGAGRLLTGSLVRENGIVHASLSLVDASENRILWGTRQDGGDGRIPELAFGMARAVALELGAPLPRLYDLPQNALIGSPVAASPIASEALGALQRHEVSAALEATTRLVREFSDEPEAYALRVEACFAAWDQRQADAERNDLEKALVALEQVDRAHPAIQVKRAYLESGNGKVREAIDRFTQVLARPDLAPDFRAQVLTLRGWNESIRGDNARAMADLEEALRLSPASAESFTQLANALRYAGRHQEALVRARQAVALSPSEPRALSMLGRVLHDMGNAEEASAVEGQACKLSRGQDSCAAYAALLLTEGRKAEAAKAAAEAGELPASSGGQYNLACFWARFGNRLEALRFLRRAIDMGYTDVFFERDPDLASLRGDPEFEAIMADVRKRLKARSPAGFRRGPVSPRAVDHARLDPFRGRR